MGVTGCLRIWRDQLQWHVAHAHNRWCVRLKWFRAHAPQFPWASFYDIVKKKYIRTFCQLMYYNNTSQITCYSIVHTSLISIRTWKDNRGATAMCSTLVSQDFTGFSVFAHQDLVSYLAFRKGESTPYTFCLVVTSCCTNNHNAIEIGVGSPIQDISSSWSTISDILECVEDAQRREYDEINLWAESLCLLGYDAKPQASGSNTRDMQYDASTVTFG